MVTLRGPIFLFAGDAGDVSGACGLCPSVSKGVSDGPLGFGFWVDAEGIKDLSLGFQSGVSVAQVMRLDGTREGSR